MPTTPQQIQTFRRRVKRFYQTQGRVLPWRLNLDPYAILISEVMLQQTQVDRVIPKYEAFLHQFPTISALAAATLHDVLTAWQGLGYNRRGLLLKKAAEAVREKHHGKLPTTVAALEELPGIGPYTARAVATFAFNQPHVLIETNIRTVFIHSFMAGRKEINDDQLLPLIARALDQKNPREWYWALMDYGSYLKGQLFNPSRLSAHYAKQKSFKNSNRQLRGQIIRALTHTSPLTRPQLVKATTFPLTQVDSALDRLIKEGLIRRNRGRFSLG